MSLPRNKIVHGDCLEVLRTFPDNSVDAIVTDPPYGLGQREPSPEEIIAYLMGAELKTGDFMNKPWDIPPVAVWKECFRVLKPGGHLLAFAGTRTFDLMSIGIRMAGFECRDTIASEFGPSVLQWAYGQGFPKSHDVSKGIDRKKGVTRKVVGTKKGVGGENLNDIVKGKAVRKTTDEGGKGVGAYGVGAKQVTIEIPVTAPATPEAQQWEGWGTALKPAWEPVVMFRKPIEEKSVVAQVLATGTGAINIDGCRISGRERTDYGLANATRTQGVAYGTPSPSADFDSSKGRWPANVILVHSDGCEVVGTKKVKAPTINRFDDGMKPFGDGAGHGYSSTQTGDENGEEEIPIYECVEGCPCKVLDEQSGSSTSRVGKPRGSTKPGEGWGMTKTGAEYSDAGGASRFFAQFEPDAPFYYCAKASVAEKKIDKELERHPTVKPVTLMSYLVRLVTPPGGVVLDPYCGSGTTCVAAVLEGMDFIGIDKHEPYVERSRIRVDMARRGEFNTPSKAKPKDKQPKKAKEVGVQAETEEPAFNPLDIALTDE